MTKTDEMLDADLAPCPFCGCSAVMARAPGKMPMAYRIACNNCGAGPTEALREPEAIEVWNTRHDRLSAPRAYAEGVVRALNAARQFISNGIELGYIRMPDAGTPDSAHQTLPLIDAALSTLSAPPEQAKEPGEGERLREAIAELWDDLVNKDDRTSPEDYPDMAMLTEAEFYAYCSRAALAAKDGADV